MDNLNDYTGMAGSGLKFNGFRAWNNGQQISLQDYAKLLQQQNPNSAESIQNTAIQASKMADPWADQRSQYQKSLADLLNNPGGSLNTNPIFKWQQQQGEQAVNRAAAANGQLTSGNRMTALSDYAQKQAGNNLFQLADLYSTLGGAKSSNPAAAASLLMQGKTAGANLANTQDQQNYLRNINSQNEYGLRAGYSSPSYSISRLY